MKKMELKAAGIKTYKAPLKPLPTTTDEGEGVGAAPDRGLTKKGSGSGAGSGSGSWREDTAVEAWERKASGDSVDGGGTCGGVGAPTLVTITSHRQT